MQGMALLAWKGGNLPGLVSSNPLKHMVRQMHQYERWIAQRAIVNGAYPQGEPAYAHHSACRKQRCISGLGSTPDG